MSGAVHAPESPERRPWALGAPSHILVAALSSALVRRLVWVPDVAIHLLALCSWFAPFLLMEFGVLAFWIAKLDFSLVFSLARQSRPRRGGNCLSLFLTRLAREGLVGVCVRGVVPAARVTPSMRLYLPHVEARLRDITAL